jgi:hypothetical protein
MTATVKELMELRALYSLLATKYHRTLLDRAVEAAGARAGDAPRYAAALTVLARMSAAIAGLDEGTLTEGPELDSKWRVPKQALGRRTLLA